MSEQVDAIIRNATDWRGETLSLLRQLVINADPDIVEELKWKKPSRPEGVPVWSRNGIVCIGEMLKDAVRLTFPKGALVKDPNMLFNARLDSSTVRAIDFHEGDEVREAELKAIIAAAANLNTQGTRTVGAPNGRGRQMPSKVGRNNASYAAHDRESSELGLSLARTASTQALPGGAVHKLPPDLRTALLASPVALKAWMDITPLARNEFICWVEDAKQETTRERRIHRTTDELEEGQRRPCCWPGCKHRERSSK